MPASITSTELEPAPVPRQARVLVVEDEPLVALMALATLELAHYVVCGAAATSAAALRLAALDPPDLALADLQLANGRTGLALAHELRSRFGTICLVTTSWLSDGERAELDAPALLYKPYTDPDLLAAIAACLDLAAGQAPSQLPHGMTLLAC
jgi:two-component system, response regulator PdtaR